MAERAARRPAGADRDLDKMMAVRMQAGAAADAPHELFRGHFDPAPWRGAGPRNYDVARDGRFVMLARNPDVRPRTIQVLLHWKAKIKGQDRETHSTRAGACQTLRRWHRWIRHQRPRGHDPDGLARRRAQKRRRSR